MVDGSCAVVVYQYIISSPRFRRSFLLFEPSSIHSKTLFNEVISASATSKGVSYCLSLSKLELGFVPNNHLNPRAAPMAITKIKFRGCAFMCPRSYPLPTESISYRIVLSHAQLRFVKKKKNRGRRLDLSHHQNYTLE